MNTTKLNKAHVRRQFDRSAQSYDRVAKMQADIVADLMTFSGLGSSDQAGVMSLADIGCGTGYGLKVLGEQFPLSALTGLDLAPAMLEVAGERYPGARFVLGDIEKLPFSDAEFDVTWSSSAIQWCDVEVSINELTRVTKSGGKVIVSTFSDGTLDAWRQLWTTSNDSQRFESIASIESAFVAAGLQNIRLESKTYKQAFTSFGAAVKSIRDLGAGNAEQDRSQGLFGASQYREIKAQVEQLITSNGAIVLPYNVVFISANKVD